MTTLPRRLGGPLGLAAAFAAVGALTLVAACLPVPDSARTSSSGAVPRPATSRADIPAACGGLDPFFATTVLWDDDEVGLADKPAVVAFQDTLAAGPDDRVVLATIGQVGSVFGLGYDPVHRALYAAAYHRVTSGFGPGGPGAVYRIDIDTGEVRTFATLETGPDRHGYGAVDPNHWLGISSLGGVAVDADGSSVFVANLFTGKIERLSTADGSELGSFRNGGSGESWRASARVFAVAVHDGAVYHAVGETIASTMHIYRSAPDGSGMTEVAVLDPGANWSFWSEEGSIVRQPLAVSLGFDAGGRLVVGVRNRELDKSGLIGGAKFPRTALGGGQIYWLRPEGDQFVVEATAQSAQNVTRFHGAAAPLPGLDLTVALGTSGQDTHALWLTGGTWEVAREELVVANRDAALDVGTGGLAALCAPHEGPDPALVATATAAAPATRAASATAAGTIIAGTATAAATVAAGTSTAAAATRTALPRNAPATATQAVKTFQTITSSCDTRPYFVVTCFARDVSLDVLAREPAIVAFDGKSEVPLASQLDVGAVYGLAYDLKRGQVYAGAYNKRGAAFGPGGPGAIYRIDLPTGTVELWGTVYAGPDPHRTYIDLDSSAAPWVGRLGLGDIELDDTFTSLFVMNLFDQRIYRYGVPDGGLMNVIDLGVGGHPFGLAFRAGWLYVGVTTDAPTGYVYRVRPDGTGAEEVLHFDLGYGHSPPWLGWSAIGDIFDYKGNGEAVLSDIEFDPAGEPILGLRDRLGDALVYSGSGDMLPTRRVGNAWQVLTTPEYYQEENIHDEPLWGGLAASPGEDFVVSTILDPITINSGGVAWFANATGKIDRRQTIYLGAGNSASFNKASGLGDIEGLCPNPDVPTPEPSPTVTLTPSPTSSPTPTATFTPAPIYLPMSLAERCRDRTRHADVVLVLDASTSMLRPTAAGRPKLEAAQEAARLFFEQMVFEPNELGQRDQVAVVTFNDNAWVVQPLTSDPGLLADAIDRLPEYVAQGTRLDLALDAGAAALRDPARIADNTPVLVFLTDGLPNRVPTPEAGGTVEDTVLAAADRAKTAGVKLYTVGLGDPAAADPIDRINAWLLERVASAPDMFYQTPNGEDLAGIYAQIAVTIACPRGRHKWGEPWPY